MKAVRDRGAPPAAREAATRMIALMLHARTRSAARGGHGRRTVACQRPRSPGGRAVPGRLVGGRSRRWSGRPDASFRAAATDAGLARPGGTHRRSRPSAAASEGRRSSARPARRPGVPVGPVRLPRSRADAGAMVVGWWPYSSGVERTTRVATSVIPRVRGRVLAGAGSRVRRKRCPGMSRTCRSRALISVRGHRKSLVQPTA